MKNIIIIIGLPGSGKSYLIKNKYNNTSTHAIFDDVKDDAVLNTGCFSYSKDYPCIISEMEKSKKNIIISDISFCEYEQYEQAKNILNWWIEKRGFNYRIINIVFKNQPCRCKNNINKNKNRNNQNRKKDLEKFSECYNPKDYINNSNDKMRNVQE